MAEGLRDEITMLRVVTRRVLRLARESHDLDEAMILLDTMGMAAIRLASLLRVQKLLGRDSGETAEIISQALTEVMKEFNLK